MEITEVRIHLRNEEKLKAYATITIDKCFVIRDLKIIQGNTGMFVAMPSRKKPDGTFKDIAHPLDNDTRKMLEVKILDAYKEELLKLKDQVVKVDEASVNRSYVRAPLAAPAVPASAPLPAAAPSAPIAAAVPAPATAVPAPAVNGNPLAQPAQAPARDPNKKMTMEEWEKSIEEKINGNK